MNDKIKPVIGQTYRIARLLGAGTRSYYEVDELECMCHRGGGKYYFHNAQRGIDLLLTPWQLHKAVEKAKELEK